MSIIAFQQFSSYSRVYLITVYVRVIPIICCAFKLIPSSNCPSLQAIWNEGFHVVRLWDTLDYWNYDFFQLPLEQKRKPFQSMRIAKTVDFCICIRKSEESPNYFSPFFPYGQIAVSKSNMQVLNKTSIRNKRDINWESYIRKVGKEGGGSTHSWCPSSTCPQFERQASQDSRHDIARLFPCRSPWAETAECWKLRCHHLRAAK